MSKKIGYLNHWQAMWSMWITMAALFCTFNPLLLQPNSLLFMTPAYLWWFMWPNGNICFSSSSSTKDYLSVLGCWFWNLRVWAPNLYTQFEGISGFHNNFNQHFAVTKPLAMLMGLVLKGGNESKMISCKEATNYWHDGVLSFTSANYSHELDRHLQFGEKALVKQSNHRGLLSDLSNNNNKPIIFGVPFIWNKLFRLPEPLHNHIWKHK